MELTLNLLWLLLVLPAIWIWRGASPEGVSGERQSLRRLLVLGCVLMALFPVLSATDDLQAMRPEMEEAGARDTFSSLDHGGIFAPPSGPSDAFALHAARFLLLPESCIRSLAVQAPSLLAVEIAITEGAGRAPPLSFPRLAI
jgi:hypothetical protein